MEDYTSKFTFEIVDENNFVHRSLRARGDHVYENIGTPKPIIRFGETGIVLSLVDGEPKLNVPDGQNAKLTQNDHAFVNGERIDGQFVWVYIGNIETQQVAQVNSDNHVGDDNGNAT